MRTAHGSSARIVPRLRRSSRAGALIDDRKGIAAPEPSVVAAQPVPSVPAGEVIEAGIEIIAAPVPIGIGPTHQGVGFVGGPHGRHGHAGEVLAYNIERVLRNLEHFDLAMPAAVRSYRSLQQGREQTPSAPGHAAGRPAHGRTAEALQSGTTPPAGHQDDAVDAADVDAQLNGLCC